MSSLEQLSQLTNDLYAKVHAPLDSNHDLREKQMENIEQLLKERALVMEMGLERPKDQKSKQIVREILMKSQAIQEKLAEMSGLIHQEINQFKQKKQMNRKYDLPYDGPTVEGVFFDKRE
ncbi:flagella biosynthesis regulatory protein FliT [Halalkalibacterium halodurans]|uniref:flagella biosynthesis regulatory protein FliT n=1 Tax=Halalkalibacterium halodurans TaxID=86665 RepID=UPI001067B126|nr:flagella biosynthesis regulatory protein FliT [Halalkalibacterium halodurans]MED3645773.1 flagella biosynthesis regulatory protein FliT [Halalkalibacterium halodurans]MED4161969.1 flagella biosynthesis regulatory protein FliT [Halalkalibacterium halodurans]TES54699.1 flagella biosynthesis regulatory protein FliT [Halalkalibacterium halodurans]